jgi:tetratricopeptide (TPR) repeat protein
MKGYRNIILIFLVTIILSGIGCAPTFQAQAQQLEPIKNNRTKTTSALAYEHYLKANALKNKGLFRQAIIELRQAIVYDHDSAYLHTKLAEIYAIEGLWRLAAKQTQAALSIAPDYPQALYIRGMAQLRTNKLEQAIITFQQVVKLDPQSIEAYSRLAEIHLKQKQNDAAVSIIEEMIAANPESSNGLRLLADLYFEQGDEKKAEEYYQRTLQINPSDTYAIENLTSILERQARYQEAITVFIEALESYPENPRYMTYMASLYYKAGDIKTAKAYFKQVRATSPSNASYIARAYFRLNLFEDAINELEGLLEENPHLDSERILLAVLFQERKQWQKAVVELKKILPVSKYYVTSRISLGYCLRYMGQLDLATQVLKDALAIANKPSDKGRILQILSTVYAKQKKFKAGLELINKAKRDNDNLDLATLLDAKANLLVEAGRIDQGIRVLRDALAKAPRDVSLLFSLGVIYEKVGRIPECLATMRRIIEIEPNNYSALNFIGYTLADQNQDMQEAERLIRKALLLDPGNGAITDSLGWVLYRKGEYQQALEYLIRADSISPGESVIIMHIGDTYLKLENKIEAIRQYQRALSFDPEPRERNQILERLLKLGIEPGPLEHKQPK